MQGAKVSLATLKRRSQFLAVAATKKKWVAPSFILQIGEASPELSDQDASLHCGFTTSSKIGNAVVRNRARRRLRVLARQIMTDHADLSRSYVLIGRNITATTSFATLQTELVKGLKRMGLWHD